MDKLSKVVEFFDDSRDCECCGTYTDMWVILDCGHQESVSERCPVGEEMRCGECSLDYEETF